MLEHCLCKEGYTSDHCERCDVGFYGEPMVIDGKCQKCSCNDNNDLSIDGSCHPTSGICDLCMNNTDGFHCEYCKPWYYGDAVAAKNCSGPFYFTSYSLSISPFGFTDFIIGARERHIKLLADRDFNSKKFMVIDCIKAFKTFSNRKL